MLLGIRNGLCKCSFLLVEMMRKEATAWVEHFVRYHVGAWQRKAGSFLVVPFGGRIRKFMVVVARLLSNAKEEIGMMFAVCAHF